MHVHRLELARVSLFLVEVVRALDGRLQMLSLPVDILLAKVALYAHYLEARLDDLYADVQQGLRTLLVQCFLLGVLRHAQEYLRIAIVLVRLLRMRINRRIFCGLAAS